MTDNREIVVRMKNYINEHITEPVTALEVTRVTGYSQFHASRIFKEETGKSPFEYLREQRLVAAAHELRKGQKRVIDVALDFVFDSHEGFTRAFVKTFGISPKQFSMIPDPKDWRIPYCTNHKSSVEVIKVENESFILRRLLKDLPENLFLNEQKKLRSILNTVRR